MLLNALPSSVKLVSNMTSEAANQSLSFELWAGRDIVELSNGEIFCQPLDYRVRSDPQRIRLTASMSVYRRRPEDGERPFGSLQYIGAYDTDWGREPSTLYFSVILPPVGFDSLWDLALRKLVPDAFTFDLEGMSYGSSPDGDEKRWDVRETQALELSGMSWLLDAVPPPPQRT